MVERLTFYGGQLPHFVDHLAPIYHAMPEDRRGPFCARGRARKQAEHHGIDYRQGTPRGAELVITASYEDYRAVSPSKVILVNHGVGQRYIGDPKSADNPCYSGGRNRERVVLHICPSLRDAAVCPPPSVAVGVPKLDAFFGEVSATSRTWERRRADNATLVVAISFHGDIHVCPETRWAFPHYRHAIESLAHHAPNLSINLLGHGHPRAHRILEPFWNSIGVPFTPHFDEVLGRADLFICDNSSTLFEFAATGRPVVVLDAPWYRTDVHHGGRFWNWADVGIRIQEPHDLESAILTALEDPPLVRKRREKVVGQVYDGVRMDGQATSRAVEAILDFMDRDA